MSVRRGERPETGPPFWSIGLAAALMLIVPIVLYSIAPAGPIREGDTVFTDGSMKVPLARPILYEAANFDGTCLLEPQDPLMVMQRPSDRQDGLILAKVQGKTTIEWPFCPPQAEILLAERQIMQKTHFVAEAVQRMKHWWGN